jgi:hypothetical protein
MLARVSKIMEQLVHAWDVLATMTPPEYSAIRPYLDNSSGFQSYQYRCIEFSLGNKNAAMLRPHAHHAERLAVVQAAYEAPSLYDLALQLLARQGLPVPASHLSRDWTQPYAASDAVKDAWLLSAKYEELEGRLRNWHQPVGYQAVTAAEIFQVVGTHQERYDYPVWSENPLSGTITFSAALPLIHTGSVAKKVYARVATPIFAEVPRSKDWVPAETSSSVSSEDYYDGALGSYSSSIGQASFSAALNDGVTDAILAKEGENLCFKFSPDKTKVPYQITQGVLRKSRTYGVGAYAQASFTVSASVPSVDFAA